MPAASSRLDMMPAARPVTTRLKADVNPFFLLSGTLVVLGAAALLLYTRTGRHR